MHCGQHLLVVSFSAYDPKETLDVQCKPAIQLQNGQHTPVVKSIILSIGSELPEFVIPNVVAAPEKKHWKSSLSENSPAVKKPPETCASFGLLGAISRRQREIAGTHRLLILSLGVVDLNTLNGAGDSYRTIWMGNLL
jgi:hypothetical protein